MGNMREWYLSLPGVPQVYLKFFLWNYLDRLCLILHNNNKWLQQVNLIYITILNTHFHH